VRGSTTLDVVARLREKGIKNISGTDMIVTNDVITALEVEPQSLADGFRDADAVLFMNNHPDHKTLDIQGYAKTMKAPGLIFDGWGLFKASEINEIEGIQYKGL